MDIIYNSTILHNLLLHLFFFFFLGSNKKSIFKKKTVFTEKLGNVSEDKYILEIKRKKKMVKTYFYFYLSKIE